MNFTRQGFFRVDYGGGKEAWAGRLFDIRRTQVMGNAQLFPWLYVFGYARVGSAVFYDSENPFSGSSRNYSFEVTLQPSIRFNQSIAYDKAIFNRASNGENIYSVDILNLKTTYQFNNHFFVRAIERYDSSRKHIAMDFLASYEPVPGTVAYAGYGASFDDWNEDAPDHIPGMRGYVNTHRSLFFKLSYLFRY
jgi:outer membrane protein assembly factor BamB